MVKAVLFDLDGTLLNTSYDIQKVLNNTFAHFNIPEVSLKDTIAWIGGGAKKLLERAVPPQNKEQFDEIYRYFCALYATNDNSLTCLYEGEAEVLRELKARGVKLAILTNKPQAATESVYKSHLSQFDFDIVLGESNAFPVKPDPTSCLDVMRRLGVSREECVFVGDGEADVLTAKNAGVPCVSVLWGYRSREQLQAVGAKVFVDSYRDLFNVLKY
jgi:phosphoglycolate phosphatase